MPATDMGYVARMSEAISGERSGVGVATAAEEAVLVVLRGGLACRLDGRDLGKRRLHRRAFVDRIEPPPETGMVFPLHPVRLMVARPRERRNVRDGILITAQIVRLPEPLLQKLVETLNLRCIAPHGIIVALRREQLEMRPLAEHRPYPGELNEQPLDHLIFFGHVLGQELARLVREIKQNGAGFEDGERPAARPLVIDDDRDLAVRIELEELRLELIALPHVHEMLLVRQGAFLEHDVDLLHVRTCQSVEIDHRLIAFSVRDEDRRGRFETRPYISGWKFMATPLMQ